MMTIFRIHSNKSGFTLLELLLVIAIFIVLLGIVSGLLNIRGSFIKSFDADRLYNVKQLITEASNYHWKNGHMIAPSGWEVLPKGKENAIPVCKQGKFDPSCANIDVLVPDYFLTLPYDSVEPNPLYSGYLIYQDAGRTMFLSAHEGKDKAPSHGISVIASDLVTTEAGGWDTFSVILNTKPMANVSIAISSDNEDQGTVSPISLIFTPEDWDTPQIVTVTGVNDSPSAENPPVMYTIVIAAAVSDDTNYNGIDPVDVLVMNMDDDDTTAPLLLTFDTPLNNATDIPVDTDFVFTFNEDVMAGTTGSYNFIIYDTDVGPVATIPATDAQVTIVGSQVTVDPISDLEGSTNYHIVIEADAFNDTSANANKYAGFSDPNIWHFVTEDTSAPLVSIYNPDLGVADVAIDTDLILTFNEIVNKGTGDIRIKKVIGGTLVATIDVNSGLVQGGGTNIITINPTDDLENNVSYYVEIDAGAFTDTVDNAYAGIGDTTWNFTTVVSEAYSNGSNWTLATNSPNWTGRHTFSSVAYNGKMWVIGGCTSVSNCTSTNSVDEVWSSADAVTWTEAPGAAAFDKRYKHTSVVFDGKMWVIGGRTPLDKQNDVWHSTDGITWTSATTNAPWSKRSNHSSVVFNGEMWVIGGLGSSDLNDVWHSADGITWTPATTNAQWPERDGHSSVVFNGEMWVMGGVETASSTYYNDVWHSADGITWTSATTNAPWSARTSFSTVVFDGKIWVMGGWGSTRFGDVWYSSDGISWTEATADAQWPNRSTHDSLVFNNGIEDKMWVIGGFETAGPLRDVWFNPPNPGVTVTPTSGLVTTEGGGTATFSVELTTKPTAEVTIGLSSDTPTEGTVLPATFTFTPDNWGPQIATVTGVDDASANGDSSYMIITAPDTVTGDTSYRNLDPDDVSVTNLDNDVYFPVADGSSQLATWYNQGSAGCDGTTCYDAVDEQSGADGNCSPTEDADTTWVETDTTSSKISFDVNTSGLPSGATITDMVITVCAKKDGGGQAPKLKTVRCIDASCTTFGSQTSSLSTTYTDYTQSHTGLSIANAETKDIEIGVERSAGGASLRITRIKVGITYSP